MNVTERLALSQGPLVYEEMTSAVDDRTLEILDRRRKTATIRRRGWLIRRMLLLADVVGLTVAYVLAEILFGDATASGPRGELLAFLVTLPVWVVVAKLYGLYDRDEERTDHSTIDDFVGVFHLVTIGAWLLFAGAWATGLADPHFAKLIAFWAFAITFVPACRLTARAYSRRSLTYLQNTVIVGAATSGNSSRTSCSSTPSTASIWSGSSTQSRRSAVTTSGRSPLLGPLERPRAIVRVLDIERVIIAFSNDSHEDIARTDPVAQGPRRADRHRAEAVRDPRSERRTSTPSRACRWSACRHSGSPARRRS